MKPNRVGAGPTRYFDPRFDREVVKIKPGEFYASTQPCIIATCLGSCVAACIRDTVRGGAGMNHFMLPDDSSAADDPRVTRSLRYGSFAMETLINEFIKRGARRADLEAKVFGGATLQPFTHSNVGRDNARFVAEYLVAEGITITQSDLGGTHPRKICLFVETGRVLVKYLPNKNREALELLALEKASLTKPRVSGGFELF